MFFSFDGVSFEAHNTEEEAAKRAAEAMVFWHEDADEGWNDLSDQVCYGRITHAVRVERCEVTDENRHMVPPDTTEIEEHFLEPIEGPIYRCNVCGGLVRFDGTKPSIH